MIFWSGSLISVSRNEIWRESKREKEEEEQVFIATAKGRNGPERPLHPNVCNRNIRTSLKSCGMQVKLDMSQEFLLTLCFISCVILQWSNKVSFARGGSADKNK